MTDRIKDAIELEVFLWGGPERLCESERLRQIRIEEDAKRGIPPTDEAGREVRER